MSMPQDDHAAPLSPSPQRGEGRDEGVSDATTATAEAPEYAVVEIFGHRRHAGRVMEVERFGAKLLRIDVPTDGDFAKGWLSHFYGGASIFSITPCSLAAVVKANKPYEPPGLFHERDDDEENPLDADG